MSSRNKYLGKAALLCVCLAPWQTLLPQSELSTSPINPPPGSPVINLPVGSIDLPVTASVNAGTGAFHLEIPLRSYPQRGGVLTMNYSLVYDSQMWYVHDYGSAKIPEPASNGWRLVVRTNGAISTGGSEDSPGVCPEWQGYSGSTYHRYGGFWALGPDGTTHSFPTVTTEKPSDCPFYNGDTSYDKPNAEGYSPDGTGWFIRVTNYGEAVAYAPDGRHSLPGLTYPDNSMEEYAEDQNGNRLTYKTSPPPLQAGSLIDTFGRSLPTTLYGFNYYTDGTSRYSGGEIFYDAQLLPTAEHTIDLPNDTSSTQFKATYIIGDVCTSFPDNFYAAQDCGMTYASGGDNHYSKILLPESFTIPTAPVAKAFHFEYDLGTSAGHYGLLNKVTFPDGAVMTMHYTATSYQLQASGIAMVPIDNVTINGAPIDLTYTIVQPPPHGVLPIYPVGTPAVQTSVQMMPRFDVASSTTVRDNQKHICLMGARMRSDYYDGGNVVTSVVFDQPRFPRTVTTTIGGVSTVTKYDYAYPGDGSSIPNFENLITSMRVWDYGVATSQPPLRTVTVIYDREPSFTSAHMTNKILRTTVSGGGIDAMTEYEYDNTPLTATSGYFGTTVVGAANHNDFNFGAGSIAPRGNLTKIKKHVDSTSTLNTTFNYNMLGLVVSSVDSNSNMTSYDWTDCFSSNGTSTACTSKLVFGLPTAHRNALGQDSTTTYNYISGSVQSSRDSNDLNGNRDGTKFSYADPLGRLTSVVYQNGGAISTQYDVSGNQQVTSRPGGSGATFTSTATYSDLGRPLEMSDSNGIIRYSYNVDGSLRNVSQPSVGAPSSWTSYSYDSLGRVTYQCNPDNGTGSADCVAGNSYTRSLYTDNYVESKDETGNVSKKTTDPLGVLHSVSEPGGLLTTYLHDGAANLSCVDQWETSSQGVSCSSPRYRKFLYDSLSRITALHNPERG